MAEYELDAARELVVVARDVVDRGLNSAEARSTVAYLSSRSIELTLKAFLERAGLPAADLRTLSSRIPALLERIDTCYIREEIVPGHRRWVPAKRLRAVTVSAGDTSSTIGSVLESLSAGRRLALPGLPPRASPPDPQTILATAQALLEWAEAHWTEVRLHRWSDDTDPDVRA
ncbi:MAG: hypothetical protein QHC78_13975 [Pigmentiphaga sp.]|uniref:hypothetical protein n=1 Tax=Pigmentiphaga sp. TaxID=1977564 RepID=UPI0029A8A0BA|nr:hypothetical protein [Pigmentiphaga sp.]MDX3906789.1 hypothetical protein [Pigmentiphaga sp.]